MRAQSLSAVAIGVVIAAPFYVRLIANPVVAALADRHGRLEGALAACAVFVALASSLLLAVDGFAAIFCVVLVIVGAALIQASQAFSIASPSGPG